MSSTAASPPSPTASFYDMSDVEEGEYNTIMHSSSGRGVKLLFSKSKVYVHPSPNAKDNIPGYIALIQQKPSPLEAPAATRPSSSSSSRSAQASSYLLSWIPEHSLGEAQDAYVRVEASEEASPPKKTPLVPAPITTTKHSGSIGSYSFAVPVSEIYSLLIRPPSIGWWYGSVIINTRAGESFPALFFHDDECQSTILQRKRRARDSFDPFGENGATFWGGDEVLRWLKRYVTVERSGADPSVYLIEPSAEDKLGFGGKPVVKEPKPASSGVGAGQVTASGSHARSASKDAAMDPFMKGLKQARWAFLEKMSQVTTFTRKTVQDVVENPAVPPQVRRLMKNPEVQTLQDEFDSARVYLARWAMGIAEQSEREKAQRIWTARDVLETEESDVGEFEILDAGSMQLADKRKPVTLKEWESFFDSTTGQLQIMPDEVKERVFHGGLDPTDGVRKEAWLFLLGVYEWDSTSAERASLINSKRDEFIRLKGAWWDTMVDGHSSPEAAEWWKEQKGRIEKDVHRTDRQIPLFEGEDIPHPDPDSPFAETGTNVHLEQMKDMLLTYDQYNKELGYVQGMSDLLSPIYAVMQDDAVAFWGFVNFMDRMQRNFLRDQSGMRSQLTTLDQLVQLMDPKLYMHLQAADSTNFFFFFRMLLVWYKREFEWSDVLRLWEALWTDYLSSSFHLFIALAILEKHRDVILEHLKHFDEILKYINELSGTIDLDSTLIRAEALFRRFQRTVEAVDKKHNFPLPSVRLRKQLQPSEPSPSNDSSSSPSSAANNAAPATSATSGSSSTGTENPDAGGASGSTSTGTSTGTGASARNSIGQAVARGIGAEKEKVISPELRRLLSREVEVLTKKTLREHGGGV